MIRQARPDEAQLLTEISFASKKYWNYPANYFDFWKNELTITKDYILQNDVFIAEAAKTLAGYYSLVELESDLQSSTITLEAGLWLEHMFIRPSFIGKGLGRNLFTHCLQTCRSQNFSTIKILADPNAKGFYTKMGCRYVTEYPSTIEGRTTPYLEFRL